MSYPLSTCPRLRLDVVAQHSGLHPDLVRRFVALSLLEASRDAAGDLWFSPETPVTIGRIQRLRAGLGLNYAGIGVVLDLLARIRELETALAERSAMPWT
ncbi:chaperone modulator CbpM [Amycolatopsis thermoflava]|uniref:chaperone modulator CbpM n=1 Tax=Amycolatopsis thermoflava TaxID=84480 RepID=UPI003F4A5372